MSKINMEGRELLLYLSLKYNGDFDKMIEAIKNKESVDKDVAETLIQKSKFGKDEYVTILDEEYPETLKTMHKPPFVLYIRDYTGTSGDNALTKFKNKFIDDAPTCIVGQGDAYPSFWRPRMTATLLLSSNTSVMTTDGKFVCSDCRHATEPQNLVIFAGRGVDDSNTMIGEAAPNALYISEFPNGVTGCRKNYERRGIIMSHLCKKMTVVNVDETSAAAAGIINTNSLGKELEFICEDNLTGTRAASITAMLKNPSATIKYTPESTLK